MKLSVIDASELDASLTERWKHIQGGCQTLRSPFYCPEFTKLVAGTGRVVRVAIVESDGVIKGFFPHERDSWGRLKPVGGSLNDYHGLIAGSCPELEASPLLKACGAIYFGFNHVPLTQAVFSPHVRFHSASPVMELQGGWDAYVRRLAAVQNTEAPGILSTIRASSRRIERDIGPLRFEMHERSSGILERLMQIKSGQWTRTVGSSHDPFSVPWIRQLLVNCFETERTDFRGCLSSLYGGDKLIACHFGLRTAGTLHYWFPVYDPAYARYQPGLILLKSIAESGCSEGLDLIDLGRGTAQYKMRFKTQAIALGEGAVSRPTVIAQAAMTAKAARIALKTNPVAVRLRHWLVSRRNRVNDGI